MVFGDLSDFKDGLPSTDSLLPNISRYSQFSFEWNHCRNGSFKCTGIRIREQSNLGAGKLVPLDEKVLPYSKLILPVDKDWPENEYSNQLLPKKSPISRKERTVNCTNDPFPYKGFKCPEIGCGAIFLSNGNLQRHILSGKHREEKKSLQDEIGLILMDVVNSSSQITSHHSMRASSKKESSNGFIFLKI